ncbi:hypothetical protein [Streptomyces koyangensis]|uniref:hypothetical protein n=1 Tax=Streptomyces koyangensis TaxID=188770 RepID=UPI003BF4956F
MATPSTPFGTGQPAPLHLADDQFGTTPLWLIIAVGVLIVLAVGFALMIRRHKHK